MVSLLKRKGFMGIFFLAAIPNMTFDLCGMVCGAALMPFWTFFGGTLLGKAVVRVRKGLLFILGGFVEF